MCRRLADSFPLHWLGKPYLWSSLNIKKSLQLKLFWKISIRITIVHWKSWICKTAYHVYSGLIIVLGTWNWSPNYGSKSSKQFLQSIITTKLFNCHNYSSLEIIFCGFFLVFISRFSRFTSNIMIDEALRTSMRHRKIV